MQPQKKLVSAPLNPAGGGHWPAFSETTGRALADILRVFVENERALRRYLARFLNRPQDIEDVAQEAFLKTFAADAKQDIQAPKSFLFTVAKHTALNETARKSTTTTDYIEDSETSSVLEDKGQVSAESELDSKRKLLVFSQAVANLPPNCRRAFLLRKLEGLKVKEIAREMDISVSGVEKHIATGLVKCSQYFKEHGYDPSEFGASSTPKGCTAQETISALVKVRDE